MKMFFGLGVLCSLPILVGCMKAQAPPTQAPVTPASLTKQDFADVISAYHGAHVQPQFDAIVREARRQRTTRERMMAHLDADLKRPGGGITAAELAQALADERAAAKAEAQADAAAARAAADAARLERIEREQADKEFLEKVEEAARQGAQQGNVNAAGPVLLNPTREEIEAKQVEAAQELKLWAAGQGLRVIEHGLGRPADPPAHVVQKNLFRRKPYPGFFHLKYWVDARSGTIYYEFEPFNL